MNTTLCLTLALLSAGAPVPKDVAPVGPAPYTLNYQLGTDGVIYVFGLGPPVSPQEPSSEAIDGTAISPGLVASELTGLKDLTVYTADGQEVTIKDAIKKLAAGAPAVASADGKKVDPDKRKALRSGTLIFVSPDLARDKCVVPSDIPVVLFIVPPAPAVPVGK